MPAVWRRPSARKRRARISSASRESIGFADFRATVSSAGSVGAAQVVVAPPPAAQTAGDPLDGTGGGRFHGIFSRTSARPQVPVAPANVSPAPKNAEMARNQGLTSVPSVTPVSTMTPAISCTWRSTGRRLRPSRTGSRARRQAIMPPSRTRGRRPARANTSAAIVARTPVRHTTMTSAWSGISSNRPSSSSSGMRRAPSIRSPSNSSALRTSRTNGAGSRSRSS